MRFLLLRIIVVVLAVVFVLGTFTATKTLAQYCTPPAMGVKIACFGTNHECSDACDDCQGMDCMRSGHCYLGLRCVLVVCTIFQSSCYGA